MEHGPTITSSRSSSPRMMRWMRRRVSAIRVSTGVARIGKKRIRCSGGGSTVISWMRWSSVALVVGVPYCQVSFLLLGGVMTVFLG